MAVWFCGLLNSDKTKTATAR